MSLNIRKSGKSWRRPTEASGKKIRVSPDAPDDPTPCRGLAPAKALIAHGLASGASGSSGILRNFFRPGPKCSAGIPSAAMNQPAHAFIAFLCMLPMALVRLSVSTKLAPRCFDSAFTAASQASPISIPADLLAMYAAPIG